MLIFLLVGCQGNATPSEKTPMMETSTPNVLPTLLPPITIPTLLATPVPSYLVISEDNLGKLTLIRQWDVEDLFSLATPMWFSDSQQFIIPKIPGKNDIPTGILSFYIEKSEPVWFIETMFFDEALASTINTEDQVFTYLRGLRVFNRLGEEVNRIKPKDECTHKQDLYLLAIPNSDLVATGQQVSVSEGGLNSDNDDLFSILVWDQNNNSCIKLKEEALGYLWSLSSSENGQYISYSFHIKDPETWALQPQTNIYDLNMQKEICNVIGLGAIFNNQGQIATNNPVERTVSITNLSDCSAQTNLKLDDSTIVWSLSFHPNGYLLAGISDTTVYIWNTKTQEVVYDFELPMAFTPTVNFSPDGRFILITQIDNNKIMLWGVPEK